MDGNVALRTIKKKVTNDDVHLGTEAGLPRPVPRGFLGLAPGGEQRETHVAEEDHVAS